MTSRPDFSELDEDDRRTVALLQREFAPLRLSRPAPVPSPARTPRRRRPAWLAAAGVAAAGIAAGLAIGVGLSNPTPVWAASPVDAVTVDDATLSAGCGTMLEQAIPDKERRAAGSDLPSVALISPDHLVLVDERGRGALAVFDDGDWTAECVLLRTGGDWTPSGQTLTPHQSSPAGAASAQPITLVEGDQLVLISGQAPAGADAVRVNVAGGTDAVATLDSGRFAIWIPLALAPPTMTVSAVVGDHTYAFADVALPEVKR